MILSHKTKLSASGRTSRFAPKQRFGGRLLLLFVCMSMAVSGLRAQTAIVAPGVDLPQAMSNAGIPATTTGLIITGGPITVADFEYIRTNMATTLQTLDMSGVTLANNEIPDHALYGCTGLISLTIPNTTTLIGYAAFENCSGLTSIEIPESVTSIGPGAFYGCGLSSVTCKAPVPPILYYPIFDTNITLSVPFGTKSLYESASIWQNCWSITELPASNDAALKSLIVNAGSLIPPFSSSTLNYTVNVPNTVTSITVTGTPNHYRATVVGNVTSKPLTVGNNEITITVTAEDGVTKRTYRVTVFRAHSTDATLKSISLSVVNATLVPPFDPNISSYAVNVENEITSISVTGTPTHPNATVAGNAINKPLSVGANTVTITVTAENGTAQKVYTVIINRPSSGDANLKNLAVDKGVPVPTFYSGTTDYVVKLPYIETDITITAEANHSLATFVGDGLKMLNPGNNLFRITVTAENGTQKIYNVTVIRQSNDATLSNLTVSDGTLAPAFIPSETNYTVNVGNATTDIVATGTPTHPGATVTVVGGGSLAVGSNTVTVTVTSEDGTVSKDYTIIVFRAPSSDANLSGILVSSGMLSPVFSSGTTSYTVYAGSVTSIDVEGIANHPGASVSGNVAGKLLKLGNNTITLTVTAENGTTTKNYTVIVVRTPSSDADLQNITLGSGTLNPSFNSSVSTYTVDVPNSVTKISVTGIANHDSASVGGNVIDMSLWVKGSNVVTIIVTAEDGISTKTYTVTITRAPSSDAKLKDLTVGAGALSPAFDVDAEDYTVNVSNETTGVVVIGIPEHDSATVVVVGGGSLAVGDNLVTVTVTAEDETTTKTYRVTITRAPSSDATLQNIHGIAPIAGVLTLSPPFDPNETAYTITVANDITSVTITGDIHHHMATIGGEAHDKPLSIGDNVVSLTVTAEDGTQKVYTVTVVRISNDATLSSLTVSEGTLSPAFVPGTIAYTVNVPNSVTSVEVTGTANYAKASVAGNGYRTLAVGANAVNVKVTAEDRTTTKTYTVTLVRAPSSDAELQDIQLSSGSLSFDPGTTDYTVTVGGSVASVIVTGIKRHSGASIAGNGEYALTAGANIINLTVTAEDRTTTKTYKVTLVRLSNDATLSNLTVSEGALSPSFDPAATDYTVRVANDVTSIDVTGTANNTGANVAGNVANKLLSLGSNVVNITVTAEDGTTNTYTVTIFRPSNDATLGSITVSAGTLYPAFKPNVTDYSVTVTSNVTTITATGTAKQAGANVVGNVENKSLAVGENVVTITVTAEDGTTNTYKVKIIRLSDDATLSNLTISTGTLTPTFHADRTEYTLIADAETASISIAGTANHAKAKVEGNVTDKVIVVGSTVVNITVTAEDETTTKIYTVTVVRPSDDATLGSLTVSAGSLNPMFNPETTDYTVKVVNNITNISIIGNSNHPEARVEGNVSAKPLAVGNTVVNITVTAQDGKTKKVYKITVNRTPSDDADLNDLTVSAGTLLFDAATTDYTVKVANNVANISVTGTANHPGAKVEGNVSAKPLAVGDNVVTIVVTAENEIATKTYTVTVVRAASDDARLKDIQVSAGSLVPMFNPGIKTYTVNVANEITNISVTGTANHNAATVAGNAANKSLDIGANLVSILVTAEDGKTKETYTVTVVRAKSSDATLKNLTVSMGALNPSFSPTTTEYTVNVATEVTNIGISGTANHPDALVSGNDANRQLNVGANVVTITVTAMDGTTKIYTVTVFRADACTLDRVTLNGNQATIEGNVAQYAADCGETSLRIDDIRVSAGASFRIDGYDGGNIPLQGNVTSFNIRVISESGRTMRDYVLKIASALNGGKLYVQRWGDILSVNRNPANNGGYNITGTRWYLDGNQVSTGEYVKLEGRRASDYAAEIEINGVWHKVCHANGTRSETKPVAWPNPVSRGESLTVQLPEQYVGGTLAVYTVAGTRMKANISLFSDIANIDVSDLPVGIYILQLTSKTGEKQDLKIIVNN